MLGGRDARRMMNRMGVNIKEVEDVREVVIRTESRDIVITDSTVQEMETNEDVTVFMVSAMGYEERVPEKPTYAEDDVELLCLKANVSREEAISALTDSDGEIGTALLKLQS